jgi:hypothetical protein
LGYDLTFWAYADESIPRTPQDHFSTYQLLCEGAQPDGFVPLPVDEIRARLQTSLKSWTQVNGDFEREGAAIQVMLTPVFARFDLYGKWTGDDANALIDLMMDYRCPLFDAQKSERFGLG